VEKRQYLEGDQRQRTVLQAGKEFKEFNVRVANYPERPMLALPFPLPIDFSHWLGAGRAGLNLELIGHGLSVTALLQLSFLPHVQVFQQRHTYAPFMDPAHTFSWSLKPDTLASKLAESLNPHKRGQWGHRASHARVLQARG
jgi:hypothetical protein